MVVLLPQPMKWSPQRCRLPYWHGILSNSIKRNRNSNNNKYDNNCYDRKLFWNNNSSNNLPSKQFELELMSSRWMLPIINNCKLLPNDVLLVTILSTTTITTTTAIISQSLIVLVYHILPNTITYQSKNTNKYYKRMS